MAKVLVVDDAADLRNLMSAILKCWGHQVVLAADGLEALEAAERESPDLILLDLHMPAMTGFEVLERLWARARERNQPRVPVIVLTADGNPQLKELARSLGAKALFVKSSFELADLMASVEQAKRE